MWKSRTDSLISTCQILWEHRSWCHYNATLVKNQHNLFMKPNFTSLFLIWYFILFLSVSVQLRFLEEKRLRYSKVWHIHKIHLSIMNSMAPKSLIWPWFGGKPLWIKKNKILCMYLNSNPITVVAHWSSFWRVAPFCNF